MARVIVYDPVLTAMSSPGGSVFRWAYQRRQRVERLAKAYAPKDTGRMARAISASYNKVPNGVIMYVTSPVYYSVWVHEGTQAYVNDRKMRIPAGVGAKSQRPVYTYYRRGQRAQPFLARALDTVMADL